MTDETTTAAGLAARAGITLRQVHYWHGRGWIVSLPRPASTAGYPLRFDELEARVACRLAALVREGYVVEAAAARARLDEVDQ